MDGISWKWRLLNVCNNISQKGFFRSQGRAEHACRDAHLTCPNACESRAGLLILAQISIFNGFFATAGPSKFEKLC
jgi:hypothetical protein